MHFSWRADKPLCHTKAEGGLWWRWVREAPGQTVSVLLKSIYRIAAHIHLLWKLHSIHLYGREFILILLILCWRESSSADQHAPVSSHHSAHCRAGWHTSHQTPPSVLWKEGLAQLRSTHSPTEHSYNDISYEDFIHFLLFLCLFFFPSRLMTVLHFDSLGWVFPRWISALSHIILIIFFRKMMTRKCQEFLGIKQAGKKVCFLILINALTLSSCNFSVFWRRLEICQGVVGGVDEGLNFLF